MAIVAICDLRAPFGAARNQGSRPTCIAFAISDAHAAARGPYVALSVDHLYWHAVRRTFGGHPDDGVTLDTALEALLHDGQCTDTGWPYQDPLPRELTTWLPPATATPVYRRGSTPLSTATPTIIDRLDRGVPTVITLLLGERFHQPVDGVIVPGDRDADTAYHAIVAVGHGLDGSDRYILVRNSWGNFWGLKGHAWVHVDYLGPRIYAIVAMAEREAV